MLVLCGFADASLVVSEQDKASGEGIISLPFGKLFEKGLSLATGQCNVKSYNRQLRDLIINGRAKPSFVVSHHVSVLWSC